MADCVFADPPSALPKAPTPRRTGVPQRGAEPFRLDRLTARGGHVVQGRRGLTEEEVRFVAGLVGALFVPGSCELVGNADPEAGLVHVGPEDRSGGDAG